MLLDYEGNFPDVDQTAFIAPTAVLIGKVKIGKNSSVWFQSVLRADINAVTIGALTNVQDGCLLHVTNVYPLIIEDRVTIGHGAVVHGCHIESDCLIGMGAVVLDGAKIGAGSLVASGSVVAPESVVPPGSLVMGVPAKVVRKMEAKDREKIEQGWQNYKNYSQKYQSAFSSSGESK